jgi:hypothetical protein
MKRAAESARSACRALRFATPAMLLLSACVYAPNLQVEHVEITAVGPRLIGYTFEVRNARRHSPFSQCRTGPATEKVSVRATLSPTEAPGSVDAGTTVLVDPSRMAMRHELPVGHREKGEISFELESPPPHPGFLVVEIVGEGVPSACAGLEDRKAIALP